MADIPALIQALRPMDTALHGLKAMPESEVTGFLSGGVFHRTMWHVTDEAGAKAILGDGINIDLNHTAMWGKGFYVSPKPQWEYGDVGIRVAVRSTNPLRVNANAAGNGGAQAVIGTEALKGLHLRSDGYRGANLLNEARWSTRNATQIRTGLLNRGYDALELQGKDWHARPVTYVVALRADDMRAIAGSMITHDAWTTARQAANDARQATRLAHRAAGVS